MGGMPTGGAELVAVTRGTWPIVGVGLLARLLTLDMVAIEDWEFERVGECGRILKLVCVGAGDGWAGGIGTGEAFVRAGDGAADIGRGGVGIVDRVFWFVVVVEPTVGCARVGCGPVYIVPSSPGAKVSVEQNPSVEDISRVRPSFDLRRQLAGA
jgi:hypothetical protein